MSISEENSALKTFVSSGFGLVVKVPETWVEESDSDVFSIRDSATDITLSASGYEISGMTLQQFTDLRLDALASAMPALKQTRVNTLKGEFGEGIEAEYIYSSPENGLSYTYRFLCIVKPQVAVSVCLAGENAAMESRRADCDRLLAKDLDIYNIQRHSSN